MTRYRAENFEDMLAHCEKVIDKLTKQIEGKNGYKKRIQQLYEENLRLGNEKIDLADKVREECALEAERQAKDEPYGHAKFRCANIAAEIRVMKER